MDRVQTTNRYAGGEQTVRAQTSRKTIRDDNGGTRIEHKHKRARGRKTKFHNKKDPSR